MAAADGDSTVGPSRHAAVRHQICRAGVARALGSSLRWSAGRCTCPRLRSMRTDWLAARESGVGAGRGKLAATDPAVGLG